MGAGGVAVCAVPGTRAGGEWAVVVGAVLLFAAVIVAMPSVIALMGALAGRLPLALRLATRDAARHSGRTAPAATAVMAAVMAAVAGFTALGIGGTSDDAQARRDYEAARIGAFDQGAATGWMHRKAEEGGAPVVGDDRRQRREAPPGRREPDCPICAASTSRPIRWGRR